MARTPVRYPKDDPPTGHIYVLWGLEKDQLEKEEYLGQRTENCLKKFIIKKRQKGLNCVFLQYEGPRIPLAFFSLPDLKQLGVIFRKDKPSDKVRKQDIQVSKTQYLKPNVGFLELDNYNHGPKRFTDELKNKV